MGRFFLKAALQRTANKALHLTAIPLRFIAAGELRRSPLRFASLGGTVQLPHYALK